MADGQAVVTAVVNVVREQSRVRAPVRTSPLVPDCVNRDGGMSALKLAVHRQPT
jgi:hypothetical protein